MGQKPTDEEIFNLISQVDEDMSQTIDFPEFLKVIQKQMAEAERARVGAAGVVPAHNYY